jgi:hypothetical protein
MMPERTNYLKMTGLSAVRDLPLKNQGAPAVGRCDPLS